MDDAPHDISAISHYKRMKIIDNTLLPVDTTLRTGTTLCVVGSAGIHFGFIEHDAHKKVELELMTMQVPYL